MARSGPPQPLTREQIQRQLQRNHENDTRPVYKLVGNGVSSLSPRFTGAQFTQTFPSWDKQLRSKQYKVQRRKSNVAEVVTRPIYNRKDKQWEQIPLNDTDRRWK